MVDATFQSVWFLPPTGAGLPRPVAIHNYLVLAASDGYSFFTLVTP